MDRINMNDATLLFNKRLLSLGTPSNTSTMDELQKALLFNEIFISNMIEMFQRHAADGVSESYLNNALAVFNHNIELITTCIQTLDRSIRIDKNNSSSFERRLQVVTQMKDNMELQLLRQSELEERSFRSGYIYYIGILGTEYMLVTIPPKSPFYSHSIEYSFDTYTKYWKNDRALLSTLEEINGMSFMQVRVTKCEKTNQTTLVELYNLRGNPDDMPIYGKLVSLFRHAHFIKSPYMFTKDISRIIAKSRLATAPETQASIFNYQYGSKDGFLLGDIFNNDILIEYPTDSFDLYLRLLYLASIDDGVQDIYITLYRIGTNPIIYYILRDAVRRGKYVRVNLELNASGETINRFWANEMRAAGIDVTHYADGELKVHAKMTLIKFKDGALISHIGTGNYNSKTTAQYTDLSLVTADVSICEQCKNLFKILDDSNEKVKNISFNQDFLVSRYNAREALEMLIREQGLLGSRGRIRIKCNSLDDPSIIKSLADAADNGCQVLMNIRGACTWVPAPNVLNRNVFIKSIIWDKLEHARVYAFGTNDEHIYIGSLDPVKRKLEKRIETLVSIKDHDVRPIISHYLDAYMANTENSWKMIHCQEGVDYIKE